MPKRSCTLPNAAAFLSLSFACSGSALAGITQDIEDAFNFYHYGHNGAILADLNYRWENVDQYQGGTPNPRTANANTARLRLGALSPVFYGLQGYAEFEGLWAMQEDYNSLRNNNRTYSVIADPEKTELNQLWISYSGIPDTVVKGGRQRIKLDDDRFIGNVGWRQLEQTYDAVLLTHQNQQIYGLTINAGFIGNVNTITSTTENIDAPILNVNYKLGDYGNVVAYGYWLDYREQENFEKSSQTYGIRLNGATPTLYDHFNLLYTAEWGNQRDYGHGPTKYESDRFNFMGGIKAFNVTLQGAWEQLNGFGPNKTFDTPLGTNHAFQGWADIFLVTPANGIRDVFGTVSVAFPRYDTVVTAAYHDFTDDTGQQQYGKEWDFQVIKKFGKHYSVLAKYANYNADTGLTTANNTDTQKIWIQGNISF
jgi:hypothetical protein